MDLGFLRRGLSNDTDRMSAPLEFGMLTASLQAMQSASATARVQAQACSPAAPGGCPQDALAEILLGGPRWREAVDEQGGSFNAVRARPGATDA